MRISASLKTVSVFVAVTALCFAQSDVQTLADQARALAPEYAADLLFRLFDNGRFSDPEQRRELLDEIYTLAGKVQNPVVLEDIPGWTDTRSWSTARALGLQLDTLLLRCRVVRAMVTEDPQRARQRFLDIPVPAITDPGCDDVLAPDVSSYYETARLLADRGLVPLEAPIRSLSSALQLPGAARALGTWSAAAEDRLALLDLYAARVAELSSSDRATGFAFRKLQLNQELVKLAEECRQESLSVDRLLAAYRKFLASEASGPRCADSTLQPAIDAFNDRLRWGGYLASQDLPRLTDEEVKPSSVNGRMRPEQYWRTDQSKRLLSAVRHLRFGDGMKPLADDQKTTDDWQAEAKQVVTMLDKWKAEDEASPLDAFHERATLYTSILQLAPPGVVRDLAAQSWLAFLADSPIKSTTPIEWLLELDTVMNLKEPEIQKAMLASKDPVISLYATVTYQR